MNDLPGEVRSHLKRLAAELDAVDDEAVLAELELVWRKKASLFEDQARSVHLRLVSSLPPGDPNSSLVLTYSGSLLSIGPETDRTLGRWLEYSSIKLRTDVPDVVTDRGISIPGGISCGEPVELTGSQIRRTSAVYAIAVCPDDLPEDEQERRIRESSIFITNGFMKYNRTVHADRDNAPDQFTMKSMTRYLAKKHGLTGEAARALIDDYITLVETGMLLGDTVPLGRLGRLSVKTREPQKARVVKHPVTGEEMVVEAKPARGVPKISFSAYLKERAERVREKDSERD